MPTVAEQLSAAREERKLTIHQLADATKIKTEHIRSLEGGDYRPFSAPVYIRGHVKALARALHLDPNSVLTDLDRELAQTDEFAAPPSLVPKQKGLLDWIMLQISKLQLQLLAPYLVFLILLGGIAWGYMIWRDRQSSDPLENLGQGIYQGQPVIGGQYLPLPAGATNTTAQP
jgi:cytoskeletal protein RodZ